MRLYVCLLGYMKNHPQADTIMTVAGVVPCIFNSLPKENPSKQNDINYIYQPKTTEKGNFK